MPNQTSLNKASLQNLLTLNDVQKITGLSRSTVYRLINSSDSDFPMALRLTARSIRFDPASLGGSSSYAGTNYDSRIGFRNVVCASQFDAVGVQQNHHGRMVEFTVAHASVLNAQQARQLAHIRFVRAVDAPTRWITGSLVSAIPPVVAFMFCQRYLVTGLTAGMTK